MSTLLDYGDDVKGIANMCPDNFWIVVRHNLGENCSYFCNKILIQFLENLQNSIDFITEYDEYDETTVSIRIKKKDK